MYMFTSTLTHMHTGASVTCGTSSGTCVSGDSCSQTLGVKVDRSLPTNDWLLATVQVFTYEQSSAGWFVNSILHNCFTLFWFVTWFAPPGTSWGVWDRRLQYHKSHPHCKKKASCEVAVESSRRGQDKRGGRGRWEEGGGEGGGRGWERGRGRGREKGWEIYSLVPFCVCVCVLFIFLCVCCSLQKRALDTRTDSTTWGLCFSQKKKKKLDMNFWWLAIHWVGLNFVSVYQM